MENQKGITGSILAIVGGAIALIVGLWVVSSTITSLSMPVMTYSVANESIALVNLTYVSLTTQANCLNDYPQNQLCGLPTGGVVMLTNQTIGVAGYNVTLTSATNYTYNNEAFTDMRINVTLACTPGQCEAGTYKITYNYYDYPSTTPYNTLSSAITTSFNALALLAVGLIIMAAAVIISYFGGYGGQK